MDCSFNPFYEFKTDTCTCGCIDQEKYPGFCAEVNPLWSWDTNKCVCDCLDESAKAICPSTDRLNVKKWSVTSCGCVCKSVPTCNTTIQTYNPDKCSCDCLTSPPEGGCPKGTSWNRSFCKCETCPHCI